MTERKPYPLKLHYILLFGKHKGKTLEWAINNDLETVKYYHKKNIIGFDPVAWDHFLEKARGRESYKHTTTTFYKRHTKTR